MRTRLSYAALLGALTLGASALAGCPGPVMPHCGDPGVICPIDSNMVDGGMTDTGMTDTGGRDTGGDTGPVVCSASGRVGAHCRAGACSTGLNCANDRSTETVGSIFMVRQGTMTDPMHPDYQLLLDPADPTMDAPFSAWLGSMCIQECDLNAMTDMCGTCATCSNDLTQNPFINALGGAALSFGSSAMYANSGLCRISCEFDAATRGTECADQQTCAAFTGTCVEQCSSDAECNMVYGATYSGELVTIINTDHPQTCNTTTGRCESAGNPSAHVGDACDGAFECLPGTGACLNGGLCAELGCTMAGAACGTTGLCLNINENQTICLRGCTTAADCGPGNACQSLGGMIGSFSGYCIGVCGDDSECAATETCTDFLDAMGAVQNGRCVPRCTMVGGIGTAAGCADDTEFCQADHDGATYGQCRGIEQFCGDGNTVSLPAASTDCATGYVCDELLATGGGAGFRNRDVFGDGHCVAACAADGDCTTAGTTCVLTGPYAGLCRQQGCSATVACPTGQMCDTAAAVCVENPPPPVM